MTTGQAKTKASELLGRLGALADVSRPNELELVRIRREAEGIRKTHPAEASAILGTIAAMMYDENEMRREFEMALKIAPRELVVAANYPFALFRLGYFREAGDRYRNAHELAPADIVVLDKTIEAYAVIGRFAEAVELYKFRSKMVHERRHPWESAILRAPVYIKSNSVKERDVEDLVDVAANVLRASQIPVNGTALLNMADEESDWMSIHFLIDEPVATVVELNVELARRLAGQGSPMTAEYHFTVMYMVKG